MTDRDRKSPEPSYYAPVKWDGPTVHLLRRLWTAGVPASVIGEQIGCSKCAIIGKADRLGLPEHPSLSWRVVA